MKNKEFADAAYVLCFGLVAALVIFSVSMSLLAFRIYQYVASA